MNGSQSLFDEENSQQNGNVSEAVIINKKTATEYDHKQHWLFQQKKNYVPLRNPRVNTQRSRASVEEINQKLDLFTQQLRDAQVSLNEAEWTKSVKADMSVFPTDQIEYLFRNDQMQFSRKINLKNISLSENSNLLTDRLSTAMSFNTRYNLRAKDKDKPSVSYFQENSSDDDFVENQCLKKDVILPKREKRSILIDPLPNPPPRNKSKSKYEIAVDNNNDGDTTPDCLLTDDDNNDGVQPAKKRKVTNTENESGVFSKIKYAATSIADYMSKKGKRTSKMVERPNMNVTDPIINVDDSPEDENKSDEIVTDEKVACPICDVKFSKTEIERHASNCDGPILVQKRPKRNCSQNSTERVGGGDSFDGSAWDDACNGLNDTWRGKPPAQHQDNVMINAPNIRTYSKYNTTILTGNKRENGTNKGRAPGIGLLKEDKQNDNIRKKQNEIYTLVGSRNTNPYNSKLQAPSAVKLPAAKKVPCTEKASNFLTDDEDSDNEMFAGYVSGPSKKKPLKSKNLATATRTFGHNDSQEDDSSLKCYRCNMLFHNNNDYNKHTTLCLEKSSQSFVTSP